MKKAFILALAVVITAVTVISLFPVSSAQGDGYLLGDANGDGKINVNDITFIQRLLCGVEEDPDGSAAKRGDVDGNGLDINDVTFLQGYIVEYAVVFPIGTPVTTAPQSTTRNNELPFVPAQH